jgi:hypothetical protein
MPRNASGIYTLPAGNPVVPGDVIDAAWANSTLSDIATELTNSLSRTGAGGMIAPFRVADGTVTAPGLAFLNETNTGLYRASAGTYALAVLGVNTATFSTVGLTIPSTKALTAQGNASVGGTLAVTGATTFASSVAVTGAITATGGVVGNVAGNVTAVAGSSTFNDVVITGSLDMTAGSSATITGLSTPTDPSDAANKGYVDTQDALRLALTGGTLTGALAMSNNKVTGLGTPTADTDAATKAYVDSVAQGIDAKASCRAATTANITLSGTQTIDGVAVIAGDRVLVKDQSSAAENGIYVAAAGAWARAADANTWDELVSAFTFVEQGSTNGNNGYICTISAGGTLGVTAVTWAQFSGAGQINAGTGMSKTGNTLNVNTASSARIVVGADEIDLATTGVVAGTYKSVTVDQWGRITAGTNPNTLAGYGITDAYTTAQVDSALALKLSLTGGTMSGAIAMGTNKITGMGDPTNPQDAATKNYIDTIFGSTASAAASASAAATSATNAATSASAAASSASAASGSASSASASAISASSSAASAATSLDQFEDQYLGAKASNPTVDNDGNPLITGALYFNTTANEMRVYNGSTWIAAGSAINGTSRRQTFTATAGQTSFTVTGGYDAGFADVYLNGAKLVNGTDVIVSSGTAVVLATGAAANDIVDVVAYGAFSVANTVAKTGDTMSGQLNAPSIAVSGALTSGSLAVNGNNISAVNSLGFRNRIINGDMRIDQRNGGAAVTANDSFPVDRFRLAFANSSGAFSAQQNTTAPAGFVNSIKYTTTTADASLGATEYAMLSQAVEGFNVADFAWGTASAQSVTLSFWCRSSQTGTFGGAIRNSAGNRSYPFSYTISAANTWEQKTISIAGDTTGTWLTTNGVGMYVHFGMGVGTTLSGTAGSWAAANYISATGAVNLIATLNADFYITGVQLEAGTVASPFERRDYGRELMMCQRYYWREVGLNVGQYDNYNITSASCLIPIAFPVTMRSSPTGAFVGSFSVVNTQTPQIAIRSSQRAVIFADATASARCQIYCAAGNGFDFSAEL